jgi:hypothetical protein
MIRHGLRVEDEQTRRGWIVSRHLVLSLLGIALLCGARPAHADIVLVSGNSMDSSNPTFTTNLSKLTHSFTFVSPGDFGTTDLSGFDDIWLDGFSLYTPAALARLTPFLAGGGTVLVQSAGFGSEPLSDYPFTAGLSQTFLGIGPSAVHIADPGNPLNAGLTDASLSNWPLLPPGTTGSYFGVFTTVPADYTILTDTGNSDEAVSIVKTTGPGIMVYTQQGISQSLTAVDLPVSSGQLTFLNNVLTVPEPSSFILTGIALTGAGLQYVVRRTRLFRRSR